MAKSVQHKRGTAGALAGNNPTLAAGEIGYETDTGRIKIGDGSTAWNSLAYQACSASDISLGTIADARLSATAQNAIGFHPFLLAGM
jgi:hypothetical protein